MMDMLAWECAENRSPCTILDCRRDHHLNLSIRTSPGLALIYQEFKVQCGSVWVYSVDRIFVAPTRG